MSAVAKEEIDGQDNKSGIKSYLKLFPRGIYGTAASNATGCIGFINADEFSEKEFKPDNYSWSVSATKYRDGEHKGIKIELISNNRYEFPNKKVTLEVTLILDDEEVWFKSYLLANIFDSQNFVVNVNQEESLDDIFDDVTIKVGIFLYPDGYVSDSFGTESNFDDDDERAHDAVLLVQDRKFYVLKNYLSTWSKFFRRMFFKTDVSEESAQKEFRLEDVNPFYFGLLLRIIHPDRCCVINDCNVRSILDLAVKLEMPSVIGMCSKYLKDFDDLSEMKLIDRLELADQYKLVSLQAAILRKLRNGPMSEYEEFMAENKDRINKLSVHTFKNIYTLRS